MVKDKWYVYVCRYLCTYIQNLATSICEVFILSDSCRLPLIVAAIMFLLV
jgi:hypothetical protein